MWFILTLRIKFHLHDNFKTGVSVCSSFLNMQLERASIMLKRKNQDHEEQFQHNLFVPNDTEKYTRSKTDLLINVRNCQKSFHTCTYTKVWSYKTNIVNIQRLFLMYLYLDANTSVFCVSCS